MSPHFRGTSWVEWMEGKWFGYENIDVWYIKENIFNFIQSKFAFSPSTSALLTLPADPPRRVWITWRQIEKIINMKISTSSH